MSISTLYQDALQKYGKLVLDFEEHASPLAPTLEAHSVGIKDEYGRLRIWGEQTRAVLPEKARYSLDEQLRENEQTRNITLRTLRRLTNRIETVNDQLNVLRIQSSQNPHQSAQFGDYEDASSSDESLSTQSSALEPPKSRLCKAIESVFDSIRSLYHISALLKRPRNASKYLRSRNMMMPSQATLRAEEDYAHILEKMRQWRHLTMRLQVGGDEERAVTLEDIISRERDEDHELADITFLCQRLTWANKLRRNQFRYWEESPDQEYEIISRPNPKRAGAKNLSATQTSFSSVANSALADTRTEAGRLRTEYTNSVVGRSNVIRVPDVPECSKTTPEFECPFCHLMLSSDRMQDRRAWKRHVFRDLRPYVCSFKSCLDPGRLFITRHDWIYHEQQIHRRKWICPEDCAATFDSKAAITEHIKNDHFDGLETRQVSIFADMCEREIDATELDKCLICLEKMSLFRLQQHLATHMEEIALFVLPYQPQDDEVERNYDDLNEGSVLDSEGMPEYAETRHEEVPALVSGIRHSRSEEDLGSLGEVGEVGHNSAAVMVDNGKPSNIKDETIQDSYAHAVPDPLYAQISPGDPFIPFAPALGSTEKRLPLSPEPVKMGDPYEQWEDDSWGPPPSTPPQARYQKDTYRHSGHVIPEPQYSNLHRSHSQDPLSQDPLSHNPNVDYDAHDTHQMQRSRTRSPEFDVKADEAEKEGDLSSGSSTSPPLTAVEIETSEEEKARPEGESLVNAHKALADAFNTANETDEEVNRVAALLADFEAMRLEREEVTAAKAAAEKAATEARAAYESEEAAAAKAAAEKAVTEAQAAYESEGAVAEEERNAVRSGWGIKTQLRSLPEIDKPTAVLDPPPSDLEVGVDGDGSSDDGRKIGSLGGSKKRGVPAFTKWMLGGTRPRPKPAQKEKEHNTTSYEGVTDYEDYKVEEVEHHVQKSIPRVIDEAKAAGTDQRDEAKSTPKLPPTSKSSQAPQLPSPQPQSLSDDPESKSDVHEATLGEERVSKNSQLRDTEISPRSCDHRFRIIKSYDNIIWNCGRCYSGPHWFIYECVNCKYKVCEPCTRSTLQLDSASV